MHLMVDNAIKFNGLESDVGQVALRMRDKIREESARVRTQVLQKKRPATADLEGNNSGPANAKKAKLG